MTLPSVSLGGLATPFDVNALIDQVMAAESVPLRNLETTRQGYEAKDAAWSSIVTRVSALRSSIDALEFDQFVTASSSNETAASAAVTGTPAPGSITFDVTQLAAAHTVHSDATTATADELLGSGDFTLTVDGTDHIVSLDGSQSITDLANSINTLDVGVTALVINVDTDEYQLMLSADTTGDDAAFSVASTVSGFTSFSTAVVGSDAVIEIGTGLTIERSTNSFNDVFAGVTFDVSAVADDVTISVARDFEGSGAGAADLVSKLNSLIGELDTLTSYNSTTGTAGILAGDSTARSLLTSLRAAVSGSVGAEPTTYTGSSVGLSLTRTGSFTFNQETFEEALSADFSGVKAFMEDVLVSNLDDEVDAAEGITGSIARARDRWQSQIDFMNDRIDAFEDRLDRKEAALIRQFSALEVALQSLYSQSQWLSSQIAGLTGGAS